MSDAASVIDDLETADVTLAELEREVERIGESKAVATRDAHDSVISFLNQYAGKATGTGDFQAYVRFQEEIETLVEDLPEDLPHRDAFEALPDIFEKRRLSESDFEAARDRLTPAREVINLLDDRAEAVDEYQDARRAVMLGLRDVEDRIAELERVTEYADVDLDVPVADLRDPIEAYNEAVREAFDAYVAETPAHSVVDLVETTRAYPLVEFRPAPTELREYLQTNEIGSESIPTLLEYADYSRSKLDHYVDDPMELKRHVSTHRLYLEKITAEPLTVSWPPPSASALRWRIRELVSVVGRFAPPEPVERLRAVRALTKRQEWFERCRTAARAADDLDAETKRRLANGEIERELTERRATKQSLTDALEAYPER